MFWLLVRKDLLLESRTKEITISMLAFGLATVLIYALAFSASPAIYRSFAPGLFWVIILFASALGLHRMFVLEKEFDAFSLSISAPVDRGIIFLAKWISGTILLIISETVIIPPFVMFMGLSLPNNWLIMIMIIIIGNLGIMAVGSLVSGLAMRAKMSEILLPILLFPLVSPLLIGAVKATNGWFQGIPFMNWQFWVLLMITFVVVFALLGYTIYDHITEE
mgnify:FL=1